MSVTFSTGFHTIKPGMRVSGEEISVVFVNTYTSGLYSGKKYIHIDLTSEPDLTLVEEGISGPLDTVADVDAIYNQLKDAGMIEVFDGFLVDPSNMSVIEISAQTISFDFEGHPPYVFSVHADPAETERVKTANQTWTLPQSDFAASGELFGALQAPAEIEFVSIENRLGLLEATNGLIKEDYNFITLVGTPSPDPGQVGVTNTVPSLIDMIVLPSTDVDGKPLNYSDFKTGDRMGLKQANGSAAIYALEPSVNMGTHFRFNVELLTLGYLGDQEFVFNAPVTAIIEDTSARTSAAAVMGVGVGDTDLGAFTGTTVADGSSIKAALQTLETAAETTISSVDAEASAREAADTVLSGRLDVLEADPITATDSAAADTAAIASANSYTDTAITNLTGSAPLVLDTLGEIAQAINDDANVYTTLVGQIAAVQSDVDGNESDGDAADAALSGRLDTLELDPVTKAYVDSADGSEATARANADTALSGRLDTLEADPTTAAAVAAVQSDVDANQTASESADTALSGRLDVLEADPTSATALTDGLALKANKAGDTFTGDVVIDEGTGSTIKLETTDATSAGIHIEGPTGSMGYLDTTNGFGNDSLQVYSANFWVRAINGGTGNAIIDGNVSVPNLAGPYTNDADAATNGIAVGSLYYDGNGHVRFRVS